MRSTQRLASSPEKLVSMQRWLVRGMVGATVLIFAIGIFLIHAATPSLFSNRGGIWRRGMKALGPDWGTGVGMDRWSYLQSIGVLPPLFPHSEYLLLLFGGGVAAIGVALILLNVAYAKQVGTGLSVGFATAFIMFISIIGLTEIYWNPGAIDGHLIVLAPVILMMFAAHADKSGIGGTANVRGSGSRTKMVVVRPGRRIN